MMKTASTIMILGALVTLASPAFANSRGVSNNHVPAIHIETFGAHNALYLISEKANVPIGVEAIFDYKMEPTIDFDFPGGTVADLLNMFVSQASDYRWVEDTGIIHVFWNSTHLPIADVMLSYPGAENKTRQQIWDDIDKRPEVIAWLNANHCERNELFMGKEFRAHNGPISIKAGSMTLAQLLDQVAIKSGENYWAIVQSPAGQKCQIRISVW